MDYLLREPMTSDDIEFINSTSYDYEIYNPTVTGNDSGWCDMATGDCIVTPSDRLIFKNVSPEQLTLLKLKYDHRLELML